MMDTLTLRDPLQKFAEAMEIKLLSHDHDRGKRGWSEDSCSALHKRIEEEWVELLDAIEQGNVEQIKSECCDVANFAMMIFDKANEIQNNNRQRG